jgi:dGTPase
MDWSDDVTYACHDVEDFYRTGLIPLAALFPAPGTGGRDTEQETARFLDYVATKRRRTGVAFDPDEARRHLTDIAEVLTVPGPYAGRHEDDVAVNARTAELLAHFTRDLRLEVGGRTATRYGARLQLPAELRASCDLLKELVWCYVIDRAALATQQHGQRRIVSRLLRWLYESPELLPPNRAEEIDLHGDRLRACADHVSSLTEDQAIALYRRLSGADIGSVSDEIAG